MSKPLVVRDPNVVGVLRSVFGKDYDTLSARERIQLRDDCEAVQFIGRYINLRAAALAVLNALDCPLKEALK